MSISFKKQMSVSRMTEPIVLDLYLLVRSLQGSLHSVSVHSSVLSCFRSIQIIFSRVFRELLISLSGME